MIMKLVVEVVNACDLMPKDGEGSANAFVEVDFANQRSRTRTVHKDLNPVWNQKLCFNLDDPASLRDQIVEVCVYNERKPFLGRNFLGRVRVHGVNIVRARRSFRGSSWRGSGFSLRLREIWL